MVMSSPYNIREGRNSYKEPMQQIGKERSVSFIYIYIYLLAMLAWPPGNQVSSRDTCMVDEKFFNFSLFN
ncbi:hypothetical protein I3842_07G225800 [Carya illinoinensis]|uniref:Uncharacterized protein n=1 Tax=Carya illinoinensis TaxID=32201 RepID=A0A922EPV6_CARIL|nr:hypothetical protein I3842_07G225800 [Carya illinoinensis]